MTRTVSSLLLLKPAIIIIITINNKIYTTTRQQTDTICVSLHFNHMPISWAYMKQLCSEVFEVFSSMTYYTCHEKTVHEM